MNTLKAYNFYSVLFLYAKSYFKGIPMTNIISTDLLSFLLKKEIVTGTDIIKVENELVSSDMSIQIEEDERFGPVLKYWYHSKESNMNFPSSIGVLKFITDICSEWLLSEGYSLNFGRIAEDEWLSTLLDLKTFQYVEEIKVEGSENFYQCVFNICEKVFQKNNFTLNDYKTLTTSLELKALEEGFSEFEIIPLEYYVELFLKGEKEELELMLISEINNPNQETYNFLKWIIEKLYKK
jgi:hypothetical protein